MQVLNRAFSMMISPSEKRSLDTNTSVFTDVFSIFSGTPTAKTSISNYKASLKLSAVYNAVEQISSDFAKIPFRVYQKDSDSTNRMFKHSADMLLRLEPNAFMTTYIWKKTMKTSELLRGNALSLIHFNKDGSVKELEFINWDYVADIRRVEGELLYYVMGYDKPFLASEVIHFKGLTHNGITGVSVITYAANQMNMAIEVQNFSSTNFENKGVRNGVIQTDKIVKEKASIIQAWRNAMSERSSDRVAVLDDGFKFQPINITPQEAQIVEMSRFTIEDISRWFNMPLHKLKSMGHSTNNNIEQQSLDYSSDCIYTHVVNAEQEFSKKLLTSTEKNNNFFIEGNLDVLVRADIKTRYEAYARGILSGFTSRNEIRAKEGLNKGPALLDEFLTPVNTFTEEQIAKNLNQQNNG
jgi:HK97 family phage portal protein